MIDPVISVRVLPDGKLQRLDDFLPFRNPEIGPKRRLTLGRSARCDIVIADPHVSSLHCFLVRSGGSVFVTDAGSKNQIYINGTRLRRGAAELYSGAVITVGRTKVLACGEAGAAQLACIPAPDVGAYLRGAAELYGSQRRAARMLRIAQSTLSRWLSRGRFRRRQDG